MSNMVDDIQSSVVESTLGTISDEMFGAKIKSDESRFEGKKSEIIRRIQSELKQINEFTEATRNTSKSIDNNPSKIYRKFVDTVNSLSNDLKNSFQGSKEISTVRKWSETFSSKRMTDLLKSHGKANPIKLGTTLVGIASMGAGLYKWCKTGDSSHFGRSCSSFAFGAILGGLGIAVAGPIGLALGLGLGIVGSMLGGKFWDKICSPFTRSPYGHSTPSRTPRPPPPTPFFST